MPSIKHNPASHPLPDFRNFGVMLRILLGVNLCALAAALVQSRGVGDWPQQYVEMAAWVQPLLLANLALLALFARAFRLLPARAGQLGVVLLAALSAVLLLDFWRFMGFDEGGWQRSVKAGLARRVGGRRDAVLLRDARQDLFAGLDRGRACRR